MEIGAGPLADGAGGAAHEEVGLAFAGTADEGDHVERGGDGDGHAGPGEILGVGAHADQAHGDRIGADHEEDFAAGGDDAAFDVLDDGVADLGFGVGEDGVGLFAGLPEIDAVAFVVEGVGVDEGAVLGMVPEDAGLAGHLEESILLARLMWA